MRFIVIFPFAFSLLLLGFVLLFKRRETSRPAWRDHDHHGSE